MMQCSGIATCTICSPKQLMVVGRLTCNPTPALRCASWLDDWASSVAARGRCCLRMSIQWRTWTMPA